MTRNYLGSIRTHLVPIILFAGAAGLLISTSLNILLGDFPTLFRPSVGTALAVCYILLGAAYEWTIKKQKELNNWYEQQKDALEDLQVQEVENGSE